MNRLAVTFRTARRVRRTLLAHRRILAGLSAAVAVAAGLQAVAEPPPPRSPVLTAARDIPGGAVVGSDDLEVVGFDPDSVPSGLVSSAAEAVGRTTAAPVRSGEPITDLRLVSGSMLTAYPGMVAAPVRIGDAAAVGLLKVGDLIDVLAADPQGGAAATLVAAAAPVISIPTPRAGPSSIAEGGLIVIAIPDSTAHSLAAAGVSRYLSIVITH